MRLQNIFILTVLILALFSSCSKEDDIKADVLDAVYEVKDSSDPVEHYVYDFYTRYRSFILFDYKENAYKWNLKFNNDYVITLPAKDVYADGLNYIKRVFLDVYTEAFKKMYFPYKILLAESIVEFDMNTFEDVDRIAASGLSFICIGKIKKGLADLTAEELLVRKGEVNAKFWTDYMTCNDIFSVPNSFYTVSKAFYGRPLIGAEGVMKPEAKMEEYGFIYANDQPWGIYLPDMPTDLSKFLGYIFSHTPAQIKVVCDEYPLVKQKFEILVTAVRNACGLDLSKMNE